MSPAAPPHGHPFIITAATPSTEFLVQRTESATRLWCKAPGSPVLQLLVLAEPLDRDQLVYMCMAGPWHPVAVYVDGYVGAWNGRDGFAATRVNSIAFHPTPPSSANDDDEKSRRRVKKRRRCVFEPDDPPQPITPYNNDQQ
jgi:hypothetical protein